MQALSATGGGFGDELAQVLDLLRQNRLVLPGVPELARRIRQAVGDPSSDVDEVTAIIGSDPALSAHLVKVANSVVYRRGGQIRSVRTAVMRLGLRLTAVTATSFSIIQMMAVAPGNQARVRTLYRHSVEVGLRCFALARRCGLVEEDALLLGLVHDIGMLPLLQYARRRRPPLPPAELQAMLDALHAPVGAEMLRGWRFPENLVNAVAVHEDWYRDTPDGRPDYADLLIAADFDLHRGTDHPMAELALHPPSALDRLGLLPDRPLTEQLPVAELAAQAQELCGASAEAVA